MSRRVGCAMALITRYRQEGISYALRVAPNPAMLCMTLLSSMTMFASPVAWGETKLIGLEPRFVYVKRSDLSQVVAHCEDKRAR